MSDTPRLDAFTLYFEEIPLFEKYHIRLVRQSKRENKND